MSKTIIASLEQPVVFKSFKRGQIGIDTKCVDDRATQDAINALLKTAKVVMPISHYEGKITRDSSYPVNVTVIESYGDRKQYRVYIGTWLKKDTFVQSDKEGNINIEKLVAKVTEYITNNNRAERRQKTHYFAKNEAKARLEGINKKLKGTGFRLELNRGSYEVKKEGGYDFYESDLDEVVAKLLTFKK